MMLLGETRVTNGLKAMKLTCSKMGAVSVIKVEDQMDAQSGSEFEKACGSLIPAGEKVVADFTALTFISSAGLRSVLSVGKRLKQAGGMLSLCGLHGAAKSAFDTTGLTAVFPVFDSAEAAAK